MNIINIDDDGNAWKSFLLKTCREKDILTRMYVYVTYLSRASIKRFVSFRIRAVVQMMFCRTRHIIYSHRRLFYVPYLEYPVCRVSEWLPLLRKRYESAFYFISGLMPRIKRVKRATTCFQCECKKIGLAGLSKAKYSLDKRRSMHRKFDAR